MIYTFMTVAMLSACNGHVDGQTADAYPLESLSVKVGNSWYHASIDQEEHTAVIGSLKNGDSITDVRYTLQTDDATISPDPQEFIGNWSETQEVTVNVGGIKTVYSIFFPDWDENASELLFSDEFDTDGIPDRNKWVLCPVGTSDWCNQMSESYDQAYVKDGNLVLVAEKKEGKYLAGGIKTQDKFAFEFGRVECRARITRHPDGAFPAIWMMPQKSLYEGWPDCGEIDIMEHIRQEPVIHQTIHTYYRNTLGHEENTTKTTECNYWDYNVYSVEWTDEYLAFYVNGALTFRYDNMYLQDEAQMKQWPFGVGSEFYLILNMGLGDPGTWAGPIDDAGLPAIMEVDWIRVYNK